MSKCNIDEIIFACLKISSIATKKHMNLRLRLTFQNKLIKWKYLENLYKSYRQIDRHQLRRSIKTEYPFFLKYLFEGTQKIYKNKLI